MTRYEKIVNITSRFLDASDDRIPTLKNKEIRRKSWLQAHVQAACDWNETPSFDLISRGFRANNVFLLNEGENFIVDMDGSLYRDRFDAEKNERRARAAGGCIAAVRDDMDDYKQFLIERCGKSEEEAEDEVRELLRKSTTGKLLQGGSHGLLGSGQVA